MDAASLQGWEKEPEKGVKNEMLLHCCCNEKAKTPQTIDLQCLLLLVFVPRAGVEPARVLPHWCLRPTRLPIPPSGRRSGCKGKSIF